MKTKLPDSLTTRLEVEAFITDLWKNDEFFHLDDDAHDIVNIVTKERTFTDEEADKINALLAQAFEVCPVWELPIIDVIIHDNVRIDLKAWQINYIEHFIERWNALDDLSDGALDGKERGEWHDKLAAEYQEFCNDANLPQWSADELLFHYRFTPNKKNETRTKSNDQI